jgi:hypothetical protein
MSNSDRREESPPPGGTPGEVELEPVGEVRVDRPRDAPARQPEDKRIHPRRPLPAVPDAPKDE